MIPNKRWNLLTLSVIGYGVLASLGIPLKFDNSEASAASQAVETAVRQKLQWFNLDRMNVEDVGEIGNSLLKELLNNALNEDSSSVALMYNQHSSTHVNNSAVLHRRVNNDIA